MYHTLKICLLTLVVSSAIAAPLQTTQYVHMRGERYCEIILEQNPFRYAVYNTIGLNHCPQHLWEKVSIDRIKKETHASNVLLNGPRYWVIDGIEHSHLVNKAVRVLSGMPMREAGVLKLNLLDIFQSRFKPYKTKTVQRNTTWVYEAHQPVYELVDPQGHVYVMQSYSVQRHRQSMKTLQRLGSHLSLPSGWLFKTGTLQHRAYVHTQNGYATVVQDNFYNTYQMTETGKRIL
jgi:hypothetical protein